MMSGQREKNRHGYLFKLNTDKTIVGAVLCCLCVALLHTFRYLPGYQLWSFVLCTGRRSFGNFSAILTCHSLKSGCPVFQRHQISVS